MKRSLFYKILFWFNLAYCLLYLLYVCISTIEMYRATVYINELLDINDDIVSYSDFYSITDILILLLLIINLFVSYKIVITHKKIGLIQLIIPTVIIILFYCFYLFALLIFSTIE